MTRRVLYVSHEVQCGGAELSLLDLIRGLDRNRYEPLLATSGDGPLTERARASDVTVLEIPMRADSRWQRARRVRAAAPRLAAAASEQAIDIIHANTILAGWSVTLAQRHHRTPWIWHVRDIGYPWLARRACRRADRILANSEATATALGFDAEARARTHVIYNGLDPSFFNEPPPQADARGTLGLPPDVPLIGMVGRLDPWKGHEIAIEALAAARTDDAELVVVGAALFGVDDPVPGWRQRAEALGVADRIHFVGAQPPSDLPTWFAAFDLALHPSTQPEPFGRSVAEAQAVGIPVIGTRDGGIPEIIADEVSGLLVSANDARQTAHAIDRLLDQPSRGRELGRAGRQRAKQRFTRDRHVQNTMTIYDEMMTR